MLIAAPNFPAQSASEVVARLRAGPQDNMPYASSGVGSLPHFAELFRLADAAGLIEQPELAVHRMQTLLALHGVEA
mgnify:CR=1 FL=1